MSTETLISLAGLADKVGQRFSGAIKQSKGHERAILRELERNIDLINLWRRSKFDIDKVVARLETRRFEAAEAAHFDLNRIKRGRVRATTTKNIPQFAPYVGWSTGKLLSSIYRKIYVLKDIVAMDKDNPRVNKTARLTNIYRLIVLFSHHIAR